MYIYKTFYKSVIHFSLYKNKKILNVSIHIAVWACFFLLPYIFSPQPQNISANINKHLVVLYVVINIFLLGFYYINTLMLIPKLLFNKNILVYCLIIVVFFIAYLYVPREITFKLTGETKEMLYKQYLTDRKQSEIKIEKNISNSNLQNITNPDQKTIIYYPGSFVVFFLVLTIGICSKAIGQWMNMERTKEQIEHQKVNAELAFLKSQVNPHFFFNTLNNIYSLAVTQSNKTAVSILKLSSIMRYMLTEVQEEKTFLLHEIEHINNYLELQMVRLTDKVKVNFKVEGNIDGIQIAPLILIPFIENAFKYGVSTIDESEVLINLKASNKIIQFTVSNTIVQSRNSMQNSTGIGIKNVKRRLDLLYTNKYVLTTTKSNHNFNVYLELNL